jgi:hypothetical protein
LEIQIFFKTNSSSKEALLKTFKSPSSTLEVYKEQGSIGSSLNLEKEGRFLGDTNFLQDKLFK